MSNKIKDIKNPKQIVKKKQVSNVKNSKPIATFKNTIENASHKSKPKTVAKKDPNSSNYLSMAPSNDNINGQTASEYQQYQEQMAASVDLNNKSKLRLKKKIVEWLDYDDKIKLLSAKTKKYKDAKKVHEDMIMKMINEFGIQNEKLDIHDDSDNLRSRVYRHKSVTKGPINEDIIEKALMEVYGNDKRVAELVKKIDTKRKINERFYLKRTKGNLIE